MTRSSLPLSELIDWWHESLGAHASDRTRKLYRSAADALLAWVGDVPTPPTRAQLDAYFTHMRARPNQRTGAPLSPSFVNQHWRSLQQFYKWLEAEELLGGRNPFTTGMKQPRVPSSPVPIFTDEEIKSLLKVTEGKGDAERRDRAIIRLLLDTGIRVGELCGLQLDDVDYGQKLVLVTGKGGHARTVPFNSKAYSELRRWLIVRPAGVGTALFTSLRGRDGGRALTDSGVRQLLDRRAETAGVIGMHPHRFRHTAAHLWMSNGGLETDLQRIMGWRSGTMVYRYAASAGAERAQASARRMAIADRY